MSITRVAKLAGVSSSTVSRVINDHPRVAPDTVRSVKTAMKELGYAPSDRRPGPKPQSRHKVESKVVAFLVLGASGEQATPAFVDLLRGVSMGASENRLELSFHYVPDLNRLPEYLAEQNIEGVLLHGVKPGPELERKLRKFPTVWLMGNRRRPEWGDQVMPDGYEVGTLAARYLIDRGHQDLAFLNLDAGHWPFRLNFQSFQSAGMDHHVPVAVLEHQLPASVPYWQRHGPKQVQALVDQFLMLSPRPTGLFVADAMQVAAIQPALIAAGVKLGPGETQIISCNNEAPFLVGLLPRPAVIDIRVESIGRRGIEQLLWRMAHPQIPERLTVSVEPFVVTPEGDIIAKPTAA